MFVETMSFLYSIEVCSLFQQTLNDFVNSDFFSTKLSGIDLFEKHINIPCGHAWSNFCMTGSKLVAMDIYVVKQACGHDI